jgi:hypothetical protein
MAHRHQRNETYMWTVIAVLSENEAENDQRHAGKKQRPSQPVIWFSRGLH